jgi:hypothetical protein
VGARAALLAISHDGGGSPAFVSLSGSGAATLFRGTVKNAGRQARPGASASTRSSNQPATSPRVPVPVPYLRRW